MKKSLILLKFLLFVLIFFIITIPLAFILKDDADSYARVLFHEFYNQEKIDYIICGASHVSHGLEADTASEKLGKAAFNAGTPSQKIDGSYALLRQAVKLYKIEKVFLELDFAVATDCAFSKREGFKAEYIVAGGIKDFKIKTDYLLHCSSPKYYINSFLPIGKDKLLTLNPKTLSNKLKAIVTGEYFKYQYTSDGSEYAGKGCVFDFYEIPAGGYSNDSKEERINISEISEDWKTTIEKIINLCKENRIELILYSMPCSDFYLNERGNYDEYYSFCRNFAAEKGFSYYDFNLVRPELLSLRDSDYTDDNHLSKKGVYVWTDAFCNFFSSKYKEENAVGKYFYSSYAQKMSEMPDIIFGLYMITSDDRKSMEITPISNHVDSSKITYDVYAICAGETLTIAEKTSETQFLLPAGKSGKIRVISYIEGVKQNDCTENFASF